MAKVPIGYVRVSTPKQAEEDKGSIREQLKNIAETLTRINNGWALEDDEVVELGNLITPDNPTSGSKPYVAASGVLVVWDILSGSYQDREGFQYLKQAVEEGKISHLISYAADRLERPDGAAIWDYGKFISVTLKKNKVEWWNSGQKREIEGLGPELLTFVEGRMSGEEKRKITERMQPGRDEAFRRGKWQGGRSHYLGIRREEYIRERMYLGDTNAEAIERANMHNMNDEKTVFIHPERVQIVENIIVPMIEKGYSSYQVAQELNKRAIPTSTSYFMPNSKWRYRQVANIFSHQCWGEYHRRTTHKYSLTKNAPETIVVEYSALKVFDKSFALMIQGKLEKNRKRPQMESKARARDWLLTGLIVCPDCGKHLSVKQRGNSDGSTYYYYFCKTKDCKFPFQRAVPLEESFLFRVGVHLMGKKPEIVKLWEAEKVRIEGQDKPLRKRLDSLKRKSKKALNDISVQTHALNDVSPGGAAYKNILENLASLEVTVEATEGDIEEIEQQLLSVPVAPDGNWIKNLKRDLKRLNGTDMSYEERREFLASLIESASYDSPFPVPHVTDEEGKIECDIDNDGGKWIIQYKLSVAN